MNINCENCQARYSLDVTMFKSSTGIVVRCRRCGKSMIVLKTEEIPKDMSVLDSMAPEGDYSANWSTEPTVSSTKEEYSPPLEAKLVPPVEEQTRIPKKDHEEKNFSFAKAGKKSPSGLGQPYAFTALYPPLPKSPSKIRQRSTFIGMALRFSKCCLTMASQVLSISTRVFAQEEREPVTTSYTWKGMLR